MEKGKKGAKLPIRKSQKSLKISTQNKEAKVNPVRNSSGPSPRRPAATVREHGGSGSGHAGGALKPAAEQRSIISNGVNNSYRESESIYKKLIEASLQGIVIVQGIPPRLIYTNPAISRILGYSSDELTSLPPKQIENLVHPDDRSAFFSRYKDRLEGKSVGPTYEIRGIRKDGSTVSLELSATRIEYDGEPAVLATYMDITERKQAEEALQQSEARYRIVADNTYDWEFWLNPEGQFVYVSPSCKRVTGRDAYEFVADHDLFDRIIHPEDLPLFTAHRHEEGNKIPSSGVEFRIIHPDGTSRWISHVCQPVFDTDGTFWGTRGSNRDFNERKYAEEALRFHVAFEKLITNLSTNFINLGLGKIDEGINQALKSIGEFVGADRSYVFLFSHDGKMMDNTHEWVAPGIEPHIQRLQGIRVDEDLPYFAKVVRKSEVFYVPRVADLPKEAEKEKEEFEVEGIQSLICVPMIYSSSFIGFIGFDSVRTEKAWPDDIIALLEIVGEIFTNVLKRKWSEEALRESEEKYRTILENIEDSYFEVDLAGNFTFFNDAVCRMLGYSRDEIMGMNNQQYTDPENAKKLYNAFNKVYRTGIPTKGFEWEIIRKDGTKLYGEVSVSLIRDPNGQPIGFRGIVRDITERKKFEETIARSEERYRTLVEESFDGIFIQKGFEIIFANRRLYEMLGYEEGELESLDHWLVYHPDYQALTRERAHARMRGESVPSTYEVKFLRKDGSFFWGEIRAKVINVLGEPGIQVWARDISERKRSEEALMESEGRMRTILDSIQTGVLIIDPVTHLIVDVNPIAVKLIGAPKEKIVNSICHKYICPAEIGKCPITDLKQNVDNSERILLRANGEPRPIIKTVVPIILGGHNYLLESFIDIEDRKQAEETLRAERERFRSLSENAPFGMAMIDKDGTFKYINPKFKELFGYDLNDIPDAKTWFRKACPDPDYRHQVISAWLDDSASSKPGEKMPRVFTARCKDGAEKIIIFITVKLESGENLMVCENITERKRAEEALRESEERYRTILENIEDGYYEVDLPGNLTFFNDSLCRMLGYSRDEMMGMGNQQYTDEENRKKLFQAFKEVYKTGEPTKGFDWKVFRKDGKKLFGEASVSLVKDSKGQPIGFRGIARDITERKQTEEALRRSEESSRELAKENAIMAEIGRIISSTFNTEEVYQRFAEEVHKLIHFDRITINITNFKDNTVTVAYALGLDVAGRRIGDTFPLGGSVNEYLMQTRSSLLILIKDDNDIQKVAVTLPNLLLFFRSGTRSLISVPLLAKDIVIGVLHFRSLKENAYSEADLRIAERVGNQIAGAIANAQLFKELIQAEEDKIAIQEQLRQSQKMEAIGLLAGGIAHDFNNLLTVIKGYAELSSLGLDTSDPLRRNIEEILKASERATNLTRQLLAFSRRQILEFKVINLNTLLKDLDTMLHRILGEDIELAYHLAQDIGKVKTDPGQIEQVILNLAVNARDAMPSGGKLIIETSNVELSEAYAQTHAEVTLGHYVMLSVSDNGAGITSEVRERIFEPFFTTKEKGKGTGLGLSTVYGIVKQSGGNINAYSEPGLGTTFKIYLPRVEEEEDISKREDHDISLSTGNETILLAEDEQSVRELAARILRDRGYQVYEAHDGKDALNMIQRHPERKIHLLLTDVVMPGMSGKELADRLKLSMPDIKVLFISGYTDNAIVHHGVLLEGVEFLQKPFTYEALARKVREVLDR